MAGNRLANWKVTAWLCSPIAGEPPALDAILAWELAIRLGMKHANKCGRWTPAEEIEDIPLPLAKRSIGGVDVYCASNPIIPPSEEWTDHVSKRFETSKLALQIAPELRKNVMTASGPLKSRFTPVRVRLVDQVCWFARGDRVQMNKLLKSIHAIGHLRGIGYGMVWQWEFEEMAEDFSIMAWQKGKKVLMKTLPIECGLDNVCGYRRSYGGWRPPYWHPAFQCEVAVPC
jgi:CRISPR type IV-associated protein Csf3